MEGTQRMLLSLDGVVPMVYRSTRPWKLERCSGSESDMEK